MKHEDLGKQEVTDPGTGQKFSAWVTRLTFACPLCEKYQEHRSMVDTELAAVAKAAGGAPAFRFLEDARVVKDSVLPEAIKHLVDEHRAFKYQAEILVWGGIEQDLQDQLERAGVKNPHPQRRGYLAGRSRG